MLGFADTSLLCALYRDQDNTAKADAFITRNKEPFAISTLVAFEFRQSVRLQTFRFSHDRTQGFSKHEAARMLADFDEDIAASIIEFLPVNWPDVHSLAERLSAQHTPSGGHRTLDVLHVATALHAGMKTFLTFDEQQAALAKGEGLKVRP